MSNVSAAIRKLKRMKWGKNACKVVKISFRANGRVKSFMGRRGGAGKNGICGAPPPAVRANRAAFRKAVKSCPKTNGSKKFSCIKKKLRAA